MDFSGFKYLGLFSGVYPSMRATLNHPTITVLVRSMTLEYYHFWTQFSLDTWRQTAACGSPFTSDFQGSQTQFLLPEEKSKELRFRMYELSLQHLGVAKGAALVAHHEDDADENRLAELGKGNIVHINGMLGLVQSCFLFLSYTQLQPNQVL